MQRRQTRQTPLDMIPMMNLVAILIPFLLMASSFVSLSVIETNAPHGGGHAEPEDIALTLLVSPDGYRLQGVDAVLGASEGGHHVEEVEALQDLLEQVKDAAPDLTEVRIVPNEDVDYGLLVTAMDATRERDGRPLFPDLLIASR